MHYNGTLIPGILEDIGWELEGNLNVYPLAIWFNQLLQGVSQPQSCWRSQTRIHPRLKKIEFKHCKCSGWSLLQNIDSEVPIGSPAICCPPSFHLSDI